MSEGEGWELEDELQREETLEEWTSAFEEKKEVEEIVMIASLGSLQANVWHQEKVEERCDGECEEI